MTTALSDPTVKNGTNQIEASNETLEPTQEIGWDGWRNQGWFADKPVASSSKFGQEKPLVSMPNPNQAEVAQKISHPDLLGTINFSEPKAVVPDAIIKAFDNNPSVLDPNFFKPEGATGGVANAVVEEIPGKIVEVAGTAVDITKDLKDATIDLGKQLFGFGKEKQPEPKTEEEQNAIIQGNFERQKGAEISQDVQEAENQVTQQRLEDALRGFDNVTKADLLQDAAQNITIGVGDSKTPDIGGSDYHLMAQKRNNQVKAALHPEDTSNPEVQSQVDKKPGVIMGGGMADTGESQNKATVLVG